MTITPQDVKKLRDMTGAGFMDAKKALVETDGNFDKAIEVIRKKGAATALKKADRQAGEGVIASYIHSNQKIGVLVDLACETDFVARNQEFQALAREIALHIAASSPRYISPEQVPAEELEKEKEIFRGQLAKENKPAEIMEKILIGKVKKFTDEICLLNQLFVRDDKKTVKALIEETVGKLGEKIEVRGFSRFEIGGSVTTCRAK